MNTMNIVVDNHGYQSVIKDICDLNWAELQRADISAAAWAYYYFSIQFRENLEIARQLHPEDPALGHLMREECNTDNLSPWPDVAEEGEKLNHDEFMKRVLTLSEIDSQTRQAIETAGHIYLIRTRAIEAHTRAMSIASYEDGGLEAVFKAILQCRCWDTPLLQGLRHFLVKHIDFDSNADSGHGALVRHLAPTEAIHSIWSEFYHLLVVSVPRLLSHQPHATVIADVKMSHI